ncbi:TadE/TadG family type IV pilus assembly protein [Sphingopyxis sp. 22461]|uniref:TadE/TadG family type IV pilus assembly protein n=1 Tax=Sphingopyxis sp. 22461 TaxID=3453923 RepID=UPI003F8637DB
MARRHIVRRARIAIRQLARNARAAVIIEMAFAIPLLALIGFGGLEIANLTLVNTRISQIGLSVADNASRIAAGSNLALPRVREVDINDVFAGIEKQAGGLEFKKNGRLILSSLERNTDNGQWIHWQRCYGDLDIDSEFGPEGTGEDGDDFAGMGPEGEEVTAAPGTAVMFVEVTYKYQPLLYGKWLGARTITTTAAFNIREARNLTGGVFGPGVASTCT